MRVLYEKLTVTSSCNWDKSYTIMTFCEQRAECLPQKCKVTNHFSNTCSKLCIQVSSSLFEQCLWHVPLLNNRYLVYVTVVKF